MLCGLISQRYFGRKEQLPKGMAQLTTKWKERPS